MAKYTDEELAGLSETERAALSDDGTDDDKELMEIAGEDDDSDDNDPEDDDSDDQDDDSDEDQGSGTADDNETDKSTPASATTFDDFDLNSVPPVAFAPKLSGELLPEYEARVKEIEAKEDEGEISSSEARREIRKLEAASSNAEIESQLWKTEQAVFHKHHPGFDPVKNPDEFAALNKELIRVANDPSHAGLSGIQYLYLAKHNLEEAKLFQEFKAARKAGKQVDTPADNGTPKTPAKPAAKRPDHQTLRDVPLADASDVGQDRFAQLDKLSGVALEAAIAKMTPEEQDAYLSGV